MFRLFLLVASFYTVFSSNKNLRQREVSVLGENDEWKQFSNFQHTFTKNYDTLEELENRFQIFRSNLRTIILHNLDSSQNFTMGINQFTDLTSDEFKKQFVSGLKQSTEVGSYGCKSFEKGDISLPSSIDWRTKNAVTSVKDQGQCGSCWTFSATGAVEGIWAIERGQLIDLSEQELVDCATGTAYGSHGCSGGQMDGAFKFVIQNGQCSLTAYPYTAKDGNKCNVCPPIIHISSCSDVKPNDQVSLKAAVAQQPVSIAIEADTRYFQSYSGGILTSSSCGTKLDHGVLIVGYGEDSGQKYWLVKNSWGTTWGDKGYVKIARTDSTNDAGICGIAMDPSFPTV